MAKICVVNIHGEEISKLMDFYAQKVSPKGLKPDTEVIVKSPRPGYRRAYDGSYSFAQGLNKKGMLERIVEAEREGCDAVVVHCFLDPAAREAREMVDIPVIGPGESSLLLATMMGHKFGIVTVNDPKVVPDTERMIALLGLHERAIPRPVRTMTMPLKEFTLKGGLEMKDEFRKEVIEDILQRGRDCVADGADVVVIGCTGLAPLCTAEGMAVIPDQGVPILDCLAVALKVAEAFADFRIRMGLPSVSRGGLYSKPSEKAFRGIAERFGLIVG